MRMKATVAGILALAAVGTLAYSAEAGAATRPGAGLVRVHTKITAGTKPSFAYSSHATPRGTVLYLQRQYGTQKVWKNVIKLPHASGKVTAPKLSTLGRYYYRVRGVRSHKVVVTSAASAIYAYGSVSLARLCASYRGYSCGTGDDNGTVEVGSSIFTYQVAFGSDAYPSYYAAMKFAKTSCRSLKLRYAANAYWQSAGSDEVSYVRVVQGSSDPVGSSTPPGSIGSLTANLDGGAFYLDTATKHDDVIDMTGVASCWSASGRW